MRYDPGDGEIDALASEVRALVRSRRGEEALARCQTFLNEWPLHCRHHIFGHLAYINTAIGNTSAALDAINEAVVLAPTWAGHLDHRMIIAIESGNFELACDDATRLIDVEHRRGSIAFVESAIVHRAYALVRLNNFQGALRDLEVVDDEGPFWIDGRHWSRTELVDWATQRKR